MRVRVCVHVCACVCKQHISVKGEVDVSARGGSRRCVFTCVRVCARVCVRAGVRACILPVNSIPNGAQKQRLRGHIVRLEMLVVAFSDKPQTNLKFIADQVANTHPHSGSGCERTSCQATNKFSLFTSITNAYSARFVKSCGLNAKAKFHLDITFSSEAVTNSHEHLSCTRMEMLAAAAAAAAAAA